MAGKLYRYHELYTYPTPMNPYKLYLCALLSLPLLSPSSIYLFLFTGKEKNRK